METNTRLLFELIEAHAELTKADQGQLLGLLGLILGAIFVFFGTQLYFTIGIFLVLAGLLAAITQTIKRNTAKATLRNLKNKL